MKNALLLIIIGLGALTGCGSTSKTDHNTLTIGTETEYPPFSYLEDGKITGFDIDVVQEACKRAGKTCIIKPIPHFDALIPELVLGRVDVIAAGMSPTPERAKRVAFTKPHHQSDGYTIIAKSELAPKNLEDLRGLQVVVNQGYTTEKVLGEIGGIHLLSLSTPTEAFLALKAKRADAFVLASSAAKPLLNSGQADGFTIQEIPADGESCSLAVQKGNSVLLEQLNAAIASMQADGTLEALHAKWGL